MLRSRQLFNNIRRYNHNHNSPSKNSVNMDNSVKTDNSVTESKINNIIMRLNTIDILLKFNYGFTLIFGWFSVFK
jgi:hypothetical protein